MRYLLVAFSLLIGSVRPADAQVGVSVGIGLPSVQIGIHVPAYPELVVVPGYPVYYDPRASSNYFFYDGVYWVLHGDSWYASSWYDGPWYVVRPEHVPLYVLRVPVRYYRVPPPYFRGWRPDAPPRWGHHWGRDWERRRAGWDRWDRRRVPRPAPLPAYQRQYSGERYPREREHQHSIGAEHYRYRPREAASREHAWGPAHGPGRRDDHGRDRGRDDRRHDDRRHDDRGHNDRGHDDRGNDHRGNDHRGHDDRGHDDRGRGRR